MQAYVNGSWSGWSGDTIVKLSNASVWEQAEYYYEYRYAYRPAVTISDGMMQVDGMNRAIRVRRIAYPRNGRKTPVVVAMSFRRQRPSCCRM
jgi:hypothetical protein